ncbi:MAG TPA: hypothetical protein VNT33_05780, partial [Telluria sp.]|nr:hypothetical protein [Telluria sp.]
MKQLSRSFLAVAAALSLSGCATVKDPPSDVSAASLYKDSANLNGQWEGHLPMRNDPEDKLGLRLKLTDTEVKVFHQNSITGVWSEAMPGLFRVSRQGANAVIQGTHSGSYDD